MGNRILAVGAALVLVIAACGGGSEDEVQDILDQAIEAAQEEAQNPDGNDGGGGSGGNSGTATAVLNGGSEIVMTITDECLIMDIGIGANAEGDGATAQIAGLPGAANVSITVDGVDHFAVAADVMVDGNTMSYDGTVGSANGDGTLSIVFACTDTVSVVGG